MTKPETVLEWAVSSEARRLTIQFKRVERLLDGMPGAATVPHSVQAQILGVEATELEQHVALLAARVRRAALKLQQGSLAQVRAAWSGRVVACYGDSITSDRQSWAEIVAEALGPAVRVVNLGRAGDTSADLIARFSDAIVPVRPDAVIVMVGTNDARRFTADVRGETGYGNQAVSNPGSAENFTELDRLIRTATGAAGLWMTPPPVLDCRIARHPSARLAHSTWIASEIEEKAKLVRARFSSAHDTWAAFANSRAPIESLFLNDGLHPNLAGQIVIAECALEQLRIPGRVTGRDGESAHHTR